MQIICNLQIYVLSKPAILETDTKSIVIHDIYKIDESLTDVELIYYGKWNPTNSTITLPETNIWKRRSNLKGHRLR